MVIGPNLDPLNMSSWNKFIIEIMPVSSVNLSKILLFEWAVSDVISVLNRAGVILITRGTPAFKYLINTG